VENGKLFNISSPLYSWKNEEDAALQMVKSPYFQVIDGI